MSEPRYTILPRVVRADREATVTIAPVSAEDRFDPGVHYDVLHFPLEHLPESPGRNGSPLAARVDDGSLVVTAVFPDEQEHKLTVAVGQGDARKEIAALRLYSLRDDLFVRRPYKGDFHIHSNRSDGREPPAEVMAHCRRIGLDFAAVTDHRRYAPSVEAEQAFEGVALDLLICRGEEVHPPDNPVHIINFGGRFSVNDQFAGPAYRAEVGEIERSLGPLPPGVDRYLYASSVWCFNKIREGGGVGVFCHPYWLVKHGYDVPGPLTTHLWRTRPFDALELIGGYHVWEAESNHLQVVRYLEERRAGPELPVIGASDAHGCLRGELFGWYYSIVFSPTCELADLAASVRAGYSVAVEARPNEFPRPFGPFRLAKFACFLIREAYPAHDALCAPEGDLMLAHVRGDASAVGALASRKGQVARLFSGLWGPG